MHLSNITGTESNLSSGGDRIVGMDFDISCDFTGNGFQVTSSYVLGLSGEQLSEYSVTGGASAPVSAWLRSNVFLPGGLAVTYYDTDTYFALNDWLGTRRGEVSAGGCLSTWTGLAFGNGINQQGACTGATEFHFTGKERDPESALATNSGNDYFGARYYSSTLGRWLSPDWSAKAEAVPYAKLGNPQTLNLYSYVVNNPLTRADADGHFSTATYDDKAKTITYRDKNGKVVGVYPANNNVQSKASIGRLQNGTFAPNPNDTTSAHTHGDATGAHGLKEDSENGEYGTKGIVRLDTVTGQDGLPHDGIGIHAGRENQPDRAGREGPDAATNGCIRTTEDSMSTLTNLIQNDPLTGVTVQNSGQANETSAMPAPPPTQPPTPEKQN